MTYFPDDSRGLCQHPQPAAWQPFTPEHTQASGPLLMSCATAPAGRAQVAGG